MLRVRVVWNGIGGTPYLTTHYFVGTTQTEADDAVTATGNFWGALDNVLDSGMSWATDPEVTVIDFVSGAPLGAFTTTPVVGTGSVSSNALGFALQGLIRWRTGVFVGGREIRGRTFVPGITATGGGDGVPAAATITAMNNAATAFIAATPSVLVVWSRQHGQDEPATSGSAWTQFAVLRSRRPGF